MLDQQLEATIRRALAYANERGHKYSSIEHLLLALLNDPAAREILIGLEIDCEALGADLLQFIDHDPVRIAVDGASDAEPTVNFRCTIQQAWTHVRAAGRSIVTGADVLVALFDCKESHAVYYLTNRGLLLQDVLIRIDQMAPHLDIPSSIDDVVELALQSIGRGLVFSIEEENCRLTLEDVQEILEVLMIDVHWGWRVSETIVRLASDDPIPAWATRTIEELCWLASMAAAGRPSAIRIDATGFDPGDQTRLDRPVITLVEARGSKPLEVTIAVTGASPTVLLLVAMWSLRVWKTIRTEEEFNTAQTALLATLSRQIECADARRTHTIETMLIGLVSLPNGTHTRGEQVRLSIPHLLRENLNSKNDPRPTP